MSDLLAWFERHFPLIVSMVTTRLRYSLIGLASLFVVTSYGQYAHLLMDSDGLFTTLGPMIGGDFIVFRTAARVAGTPDMVSIYTLENLSGMLRAAYPGHGSMMVGWMYPPSMYLAVRPFAFLPFVMSFLLWVVVFGGLFAVTIRRLWSNGTALFFALASPAVLQAIITGQTGLLTASLIALTGSFAERQPLLAGVAAGLLTVKPQFGLLIPVALVASGSWRTFWVATVTAIALAGASVAAYGVAPWFAFLASLQAHGARMSDLAHFPMHKLVTPYGAARLLGASAQAGTAVQGVATCLLAAYVYLVWRRVSAVDLRLAALATAAPLATPYAFYYELAILVPPMLLLAKHATETGWLRGERLSLAVLWIATLWPPGPEYVPSFPVSFAVAGGALIIAARRTLPAVRRGGPSRTITSAAPP
jgi:hypothetical protein